jgi:hypothetical protein
VANEPLWSGPLGRVLSELDTTELLGVRVNFPEPLRSLTGGINGKNAIWHQNEGLDVLVFESGEQLDLLEIPLTAEVHLFRQ